MQICYRKWLNYSTTISLACGVMFGIGRMLVKFDHRYVFASSLPGSARQNAPTCDQTRHGCLRHLALRLRHIPPWHNSGEAGTRLKSPMRGQSTNFKTSFAKNKDSRKKRGIPSRIPWRERFKNDFCHPYWHESHCDPSGLFLGKSNLLGHALLIEPSTTPYNENRATNGAKRARLQAIS